MPPPVSPSATLLAGSLHFDYIITGAGAAGLSLLVRMLLSGKFTHKTILLVDREQKTKNDRTWCFWETGEGLFESIIHKRWRLLWFHGEQYSEKFDIAPYQYKMIRGIDFYAFCFRLIGMHKNVTVQYGSVTGMHSEKNHACLLLDGEPLTAGCIFNSILFTRPEIARGQYHLLQHFKGWVVETSVPAFNEHEATLMDFRVGQQHGAAFVYVMPFSATRALVEYTLFTEKLLQPHEYDDALAQYIHRFMPCSFTIAEEEFGQIPMTNYLFPSNDGHIIHIGTAGGQTKASSGYTFQFIQKKTAAIVKGLIANGKLPAPAISRKFRFYDSVFLNVLATGKLPGSTVFTQLFRNNPPHRIFRFLDNESSLSEDLQLITTLPILPFLKAGLQQVKKLRIKK